MDLGPIREPVRDDEVEQGHGFPKFATRTARDPEVHLPFRCMAGRNAEGREGVGSERSDRFRAAECGVDTAEASRRTHLGRVEAEACPGLPQRQMRSENRTHASD